MSESISGDVRDVLQDILAQLANLADRVETMEKSLSSELGLAAPVASEVETRVADASDVKSPAVVGAGISQEEVLAISAAIATWLGIQAHIRQIRLISNRSWAQQGRVTVQASHSLHY